MRLWLGAAVVSVGLPALSAAQEVVDIALPRTRLEAFAEQSGVVIIRGSSRVGDVRAQNGSAVVVESKEFTNARTGERAHGITVEVKEAGTEDREHTSYVDFDEIPLLLQGLEYIGKVERSATALDQFRADYRTRDDLRISTFSSENRWTQVAVSSGTIERARAHLAISDLEQMRALIQTAYTMLGKLRARSK